MKKHRKFGAFMLNISICGVYIDEGYGNMAAILKISFHPANILHDTIYP